jgi:protein SCO1
VKKRILSTLFLALCTTWGAVSPSLAQNMRQPVVSKAGQPATEQTYDSGLPSQLSDVGIDQKLNQQLPLDAEFTNDKGEQVKLRDYFREKPVVFAFAYYTCPMLCGQVLQGVTGSLRALSFDAGKEFDVVVVSFDPRDSLKHAVKAKNTYIHRYGRPGSENGWHFLFGDSNAIRQVTQAAGFKYRWDELSKQYAHGSAMMVVTPDGKLSKYFFGIEFAPKDVKFALMEAAENKIGTVIDQVMLYCFHYDPKQGKYGPYVVNILRLGASATIIAFGAFYISMRKRSKRKKLAAKAPELTPEQRN